MYYVNRKFAARSGGCIVVHLESVTRCSEYYLSMVMDCVGEGYPGYFFLFKFC